MTTRRLTSVLATAVVAVVATARVEAQRRGAAQTLEMSTLELQVLLDRAGFSPGEIDGVGGSNTTAAVPAYRRQHAPADTDWTMRLGRGSIDYTTTYTITAEDAAGPFTPDIPQDLMEQAQLPALNYSSLIEALGERFHCAPAVLRALNPGTSFDAGQTIRVPNVNAGIDAPQPTPGLTVTVSKRTSVLTVTNAAGRTVFHAPVTSGSEHDPLPLGRWTVTAIMRNPTFNYNPDLFWDADPSDAKAKIPAGPNGPVGVVWIQISKANYGIHGTPEPSQIGHSASHGCVRMTNWDASHLANMIGKGTPVVFVE